MDLVADMKDYEQGLLDFNKTVELFQYLIDSGMLEHLGQNYNAVADSFIRNGFCRS